MNFDLVFLCIVCLFIAYTLFDSQTNESMTDTSSTSVIQDAVKQVYLADVQAIRNLSNVATQLQNGGLTVPGNLTTSGNLTTNGNLVSGVDNISLGPKEIKMNNSGKTHYSITNDGNFNIVNTSNGSTVGTPGTKIITVNGNGTTINCPKGSSALPSLELTDGTQFTRIHNNLPAMNWNPIVQTNDSAIIFRNLVTPDTSAFVIAPWSGTNSGIRITEKNTTVGGNLSVLNGTITGKNNVISSGGNLTIGSTSINEKVLQSMYLVLMQNKYPSFPNNYITYTYAGCYNDAKTGVRTIPIYYGSVTSVSQAKEIASTYGANVFGIQYGGELYLGMDSAKAKSLGPQSSSSLCIKPGSSVDLGGGYTNQVYINSAIFANV